MHIHYREAVKKLLAGGVIAYPTEAVWGLGCDPNNEEAVNRLLFLKDRPVEKGLILVGADIGQFESLILPLSDSDRAKLSASWPGPVTWLVPHQGTVPEWISGQFDTVAIRVSDHPGVQELCRSWGGPLVSTSANPSSGEPALDATQCREYFGDALDFICDGEVGTLQRPTLIKDLRSGEVIRPG